MSQSERVHFKIALPVDLKQRLEHQAVESRRSLSAEIIHRLEISLAADDLPDEHLDITPGADDSVERVTLLLNEALAIVSRYKKVLGEE